MYFVIFYDAHDVSHSFFSSDLNEVLRFVSHLLTHSLFCPMAGIDISRFPDPSDIDLLDLDAYDIVDLDGFSVYAKHPDSGDGDPLYAELEAERYREAREDEEEISSGIII